MNDPSTLAELPEVLSVDEVAAYLRIGRTSVYEAIKEKVIPAVRIGRRILIPRKGVEQLLLEPIGETSERVHREKGTPAL